jgi:lipopolysaccharide/colanic/teichoic acid biosynthesis glycosyltransferase
VHRDLLGRRGGPWAGGPAIAKRALVDKLRCAGRSAETHVSPYFRPQVGETGGHGQPSADFHKVLQNYHGLGVNLVLSTGVRGPSPSWRLWVRHPSRQFGGSGGKALRRSILISADLLLVAFATVLAIMLRGNFDTFQDALIILIPYMFIFLGCASIVFLVGGLDRTPWRYSSVADHLQIIVLTVVVTLLALVLTFAANRLEGVARSLPVLQGGLMVIFLVSARGAASWFARQRGTNEINGNGHINGHPHETVLVVGVNTVSELFLCSVREFASQVQVAGVLAEDPTMRGRVIQQKPILGTVEELWDILQSLEVHGILVDRIVVATPADRLLPHALATLLEVEKSSDLVVHFLSERLGFEDLSQAPISSRPERSIVHGQTALALAEDVKLVNSVRKPFWIVKRIVDCFFAAFLIFTLAPVVALIALIVALDIGFPLIFWQQRPGLYGRPFKLYKFRTMGAPHDKRSRRISDEQRLSAVGRILRRTRLDELPQLYNVLLGHMSFIGPRPLLPRDQSPEHADRLLVRPGITGWAQVNGGRIISPLDKWALDVWYVQNASFMLDFKIVLRTMQMILFGDQINPKAIYHARSDLGPTVQAPVLAEMTPAE